MKGLKIVFGFSVVIMLLSLVHLEANWWGKAKHWVKKASKKTGHAITHTAKEAGKDIKKAGKAIGKGLKDLPKGIAKPFKRDKSLFRNFKVENKSDYDMKVLVQWFKPGEGVECYPYYCGGDSVIKGVSHDFLCGKADIGKGDSHTFEVPYKNVDVDWIGLVGDVPCTGIPKLSDSRKDSGIENDITIWVYYEKHGKWEHYSFQGYVPDVLTLGTDAMLVKHTFVNCSAAPQQISLRAPLATDKPLDVLIDVAKVGMFFAGFVSMKLLPVQMIVSPLLQHHHQNYITVSAILYPTQHIELGFPQGLPLPIKENEVQYKVDSGGQYAEEYEGWKPLQRHMHGFRGIGKDEVIEITSQAETVCNCPYEYEFPRLSSQVADYDELRTCAIAKAKKATLEDDLDKAKKGKDKAKIKQLQDQVADVLKTIDSADCKRVADMKFMCLSPKIPGLPESKKQEYAKYAGDEAKGFCCSTIQDSVGLCVNDNANVGNTYYFSSSRLKSMEYKSCTTKFQKT